MTCRDVLDLLDNSLDGELPEELDCRLQRHVLRCAGCREELDTRQRALMLLHRTHQAPDLSEAFLQRTLNTLAAELDLDEERVAPPDQLVLGIGQGLPSASFRTASHRPR